MADETLFDFLHSEIVNYALEQKKEKNNKVGIINTSYNLKIFVCNSITTFFRFRISTYL